MKELLLTKGEKAIVDDDDYELLKIYKWHYQGKYAGRYEKSLPSKRMYLHRQILNAPSGHCVDHINNNPLDCRKENLRLCTYTQNNWNRSADRDSQYSSYKGVTYSKERRKWIAKIQASGHSYFLGYYEQELHAVIAYQAAARVLHKDFTKALSFDPLQSA